MWEDGTHRDELPHLKTRKATGDDHGMRGNRRHGPNEEGIRLRRQGNRGNIVTDTRESDRTFEENGFRSDIFIIYIISGTHSFHAYRTTWRKYKYSSQMDARATTAREDISDF